VLDFIVEDVAALDCGAEIAQLRRIVVEGTSADRQIAIYQDALKAGHKRLTALKEVIDCVARETLAD
jgi:carboxylate-amine ligase